MTGFKDAFSSELLAQFLKSGMELSRSISDDLANIELELSAFRMDADTAAHLHSESVAQGQTCAPGGMSGLNALQLALAIAEREVNDSRTMALEVADLTADPNVSEGRLERAPQRLQQAGYRIALQVRGGKGRQWGRPGLALCSERLRELRELRSLPVPWAELGRAAGLRQGSRQADRRVPESPQRADLPA